MVKRKKKLPNLTRWYVKSSAYDGRDPVDGVEHSIVSEGTNSRVFHERSDSVTALK